TRPQDVANLAHALVFAFLLYSHTPPTQTYTLSLHDALPISRTTTCHCGTFVKFAAANVEPTSPSRTGDDGSRIASKISEFHERRSEEHTSELQSRFDIVCRLLLEKKKTASTRRHSERDIFKP